MGVEGVRTYLKPGDMEKISAPPGFVSQTSFVLRSVHRDRETSRLVSGQEQITGYGTDDADSLMFRKDRPWIVHAHTTPPSSEVSKPMESKVRAKRLPKVSETKVLEEAPVFHPNEEEFSDVLSYIASLRERAEPYGICSVVPPPSWKPPCLLKEEKLWEASKFSTQVQLFDSVHTEKPNVIKEEADADHDDAASEKVKFCRTSRGPGHNLKSFKDYADSSKKNYFSKNDEVLVSKNSSVKLEEPTVEDIEREYRQLVENPLVEAGVLYGKDLDTRKFGRGFPLPGSSESCKYRTSGWNLNNTAKLPGSLLSLEDCESICAPRLCVGMCFSSQLWKSEKERLYSLCYLHMGAPRVWYSVAGSHRSKFKATMMSLIPEMSGEEPKTSNDPVIVSPYALSMEGISVTKCVQKAGQYVIIFPGSYYSAFSCGFNCLEKVNFAPLDWLPHGDIAVQLNQEKSRKSLISYDKLLLTAAGEAVKCLKENKLSRKNIGNYNSYCGEDGLLTNIVKSRVKQEKSRREFLSRSLVSQRMDKSYDGVSRIECCVCFVDLHLSAVQCSCSDDRYSCLSHMRNLCACPCDKKSLVYRYNIDELNLLVEALEGKLSAMMRWEEKIDRSCSSRGEEDKGKKSDEVNNNNIMKVVAEGIREQMKARMKARSMNEIMNVKEGKDDESLKSCSKKSSRPSDSSEVNAPKKQRQG